MNRHLNFVTLICLITLCIVGFCAATMMMKWTNIKDIYQNGSCTGAEMGAAVVVDCVSNSSTADRSDFEIQLCAPYSRLRGMALGVDTLKVDTYNSANKTKCVVAPR